MNVQQKLDNRARTINSLIRSALSASMATSSLKRYSLYNVQQNVALTLECRQIDIGEKQCISVWCVVSGHYDLSSPHETLNHQMLRDFRVSCFSGDAVGLNAAIHGYIQRIDNDDWDNMGDYGDFNGLTEEGVRNLVAPRLREAAKEHIDKVRETNKDGWLSLEWLSPPDRYQDDQASVASPPVDTRQEHKPADPDAVERVAEVLAKNEAIKQVTDRLLAKHYDKGVLFHRLCSHVMECEMKYIKPVAEKITSRKLFPGSKITREQAIAVVKAFAVK